MKVLKHTIFFLFLIACQVNFAQKHQLDKEFEKTYNDTRENGMNGALANEMLSENMIADWDIELNRVYKELMTKLPDYKKTQLKESQRKWIEYRDLNFKLLNDIDKDVMYPQPKSREMQFIRQRVLELIDISQRYDNENDTSINSSPKKTSINTVNEIKNELAESYVYANEMIGLTGESLNKAIANGNRHYNKAYNLFLSLQSDTSNDLSKEKLNVISESLKVYAEVFNNKYSIAQNFKPEIDFIKSNLEKFPNEITQIEKDNEENLVRVILGSRSKRQIILPKNGNWCLWEIIGDDRIWIEGYVPKNGFAKYDVHSNQLPMFLGNEKEFILSSNLKNTQFIFRQCEKE